MEDQEYTDAVVALWENTYEQKFKTLAWRITHYLREQGYTMQDPFDMSDDTFRWATQVMAAPTDHVYKLPEPVDIWIELAESLEYGDGDAGVNFSIDVTAEGGAILGGLTPYNYTPECWVSLDNKEALEDRFAVLERADMSGYAVLLAEYAAKAKVRA